MPNPQCKYEYIKKWRKEHPEIDKKYQLQRYAKNKVKMLRKSIIRYATKKYENIEDLCNYLYEYTLRHDHEPNFFAEEGYDFS